MKCHPTLNKKIQYSLQILDHMIEGGVTNNSLFQQNGSQSMEKGRFLCLNPGCTVLGVGCFQQSEITLHDNCTGWIIKTSDIDRIMSPQASHQNDTQNTFDFKFQPLKSLFEIGPIFQSVQNGPNFCNPIQLLKVNFELIKSKIQNQLARVFHEISYRIQKIKQIQEKTLYEITNILVQKDTQKISKAIRQSVPLREYKEFCKAADFFTLIKEEKITKEIFKIFESIENIGRSFWNTELESFKRQKEILEDANKNIENFTQDESIHPNIKLQRLANMFEAKTITPFVAQNKMNASVKCWICNQFSTGNGANIKQHKAKACQNLINHVMTVHQKQTMSKFVCQILKTALHKITFEELVAEIEQKNYNQYIIIDRQNSNKSIQELMISQGTYIINVLSNQNQKIASGKYILANSSAKDSADTLMIMIIYAIVTSGYFKLTCHFSPENKPKITLVTKDHFADTLKYILKNDFNVEIQIIK